MSVPAEYPAPVKYGERVRFKRRENCGGRVAALEGEGTFELHWLGIEECWDVRLDGGEKVALFPCFGDTMEPIAGDEDRP